MKSPVVWILAILAVGANAPVTAALAGRAPATPGGSDFQAYYDTVLDITWLANASLPKTESFGLEIVSGAAHGVMSWYTARSYLEAMNRVGYLGVTTWRLPRETPLDGTAFDLDASADGSTDLGRGVPDGWIGVNGEPVSELGHMYYVNLALTTDYFLDEYLNAHSVIGVVSPEVV